MDKGYLFFKGKLLRCILKYSFACFLLLASFSKVIAQSITLSPSADAFVRDGSYAAINYGSDTSLVVKGGTVSGYVRKSYLKFSLLSAARINSAKLRIYGSNTDNTASINISCYSVDTDSWTESAITFNTAPASSASAIASAGVTNLAKYYEFDVTSYVKDQFGGDKVVSFLIKDAANQNTNIYFNSKENSKNKPQLFVDTLAGTVTRSNADLFIENLDKFPSNDHFAFSKIQIPWSRDSVNFNANHDSLTVRIYNKGINSLTVKNLTLSNTNWKFVKLKGVDFNSGTSLPLTVSSGTYADLTVKFTPPDGTTRVKIWHDTLTIVQMMISHLLKLFISMDYGREKVKVPMSLLHRKLSIPLVLKPLPVMD